jgi:8-oxo-dGTP diphosphatase
MLEAQSSPIRDVPSSQYGPNERKISPETVEQTVKHIIRDYLVFSTWPEQCTSKGNPLDHRIRAAVILVRDREILLVKHVDPSTCEEWWIPPGGGLVGQDRSIVECAVREVYEETGLNVAVGRLIYLRDFIELAEATYHVELFFLADDFTDELTLENVIGKGPEEDFIKQVSWLGKDEMQGLTVYPEHLLDSFWQDLDNGFPEVRYLGVQTA